MDGMGGMTSEKVKGEVARDNLNRKNGLMNCPNKQAKAGKLASRGVNGRWNIIKKVRHAKGIVVFVVCAYLFSTSAPETWLKIPPKRAIYPD